MTCRDMQTRDKYKDVTCYYKTGSNHGIVPSWNNLEAGIPCQRGSKV